MTIPAYTLKGNVEGPSYHASCELSDFLGDRYFLWSIEGITPLQRFPSQSSQAKHPQLLQSTPLLFVLFSFLLSPAALRKHKSLLEALCLLSQHQCGCSTVCSFTLKPLASHRSEVGGQGSEFGGQGSEVRNWSPSAEHQQLPWAGAVSSVQGFHWLVLRWASFLPSFTIK